MDELITAAQAAKELNVSDVTIHRQIKKGEVKARRVGHTWVLRRKDLHAIKIRPAHRPKKV